jgi:predicted NBD/HSP70 family sugar kinase
VTEAIDQPALRRHNLGLVLRTIRDHEPRPRARIAAATGLNRTTVSSLVAELGERGLVRGGVLERGNVGRPGLNVELDGRRVCGIGAEVNVNHVGTMALDLRGEVVSAHRLSLDTVHLDPGAVFDRLAALVGRTLQDLDDRSAQPVGLTLGLAGLVDSAAGVLTLGPNLGWRDVPAAQLLADRLGRPSCPVLVDNEANLAAIAEAGSTPDGVRDDILVLVGEVGVGGGIVSRGALLRGRHGFAGEIGHMMVDPQGRHCGCGRTGCWETVIGLRALVTAATAPDDALRDPALDLEDRLAELNRRAELGDARTLGALTQVGRWIGLGAAALVNVLNPSTLVLSGYFAEVGRWMVEAIETTLVEGAIAPQAGGCRVELSSLGFSAAVRGGAQVAIDTVFQDPTVVARTNTGDVVEPVGGTR